MALNRMGIQGQPHPVSDEEYRRAIGEIECIADQSDGKKWTEQGFPDCSHLVYLQVKTDADASTVSGWVKPQVRSLIHAAPDLLALAHQYASECAGCNGAGTWTKTSNISGPADRVPCEDCAGIRAVIAKATGAA
jgi:hypothetical protein